MVEGAVETQEEENTLRLETREKEDMKEERKEKMELVTI